MKAKTLLLTRPAKENARIAGFFEQRGWRVLSAPMLAIEFLPPPPNWPDLAQSAQAFVATSANALEALMGAPSALPPALLTRDFFAIGPATAEAAQKAGFVNIYRAASSRTELARLIATQCRAEAGPVVHLSGAQIAFPLDKMPELAGFSIARAIFYQARQSQTLTPEAEKCWRSGDLAAVLVFSPRAAQALAAIIQRLHLPCASMMVLGLTESCCLPLTQSGFETCRAAGRADMETLFALLPEGQG